MARRIRHMAFPARTLLCVFAALCCLAAARPARGQDAPADITLEQIDTMKSEIQSLRGLDFTDPVQVRFVSQDQIADAARDIMQAQGMGPEYVEATGRMMQAFGFLESADMLQAALDAVLSQQVAGLYDPASKALYVARDAAPPQDAPALDAATARDMTLSHELTHALQDQHFNLERLDSLRVQSEDAALALKCVVEGDAMAVMMDYSLRGTGVRALDMPSLGALMDGMLQSPGAAGAFPDVPEVIRAQFVFPYTGGLDFLAAVHAARKQAGLNAAFTDPPLSSEQILHPEKYLEDRDDPVDVQPGDLARFAPAGAELLESNVLGEFHVRLLLKALLRADDEAAWAAPAAGWDGDRYAAFSAPPGRTILFWASAWDSPAHAAAFFDAYVSALDARFGTSADRAAAGRAIWHTDCGPVAVALSRDRVAMAHCPDAQVLNAALDALLTAGTAPLSADR